MSNAIVGYATYVPTWRVNPGGKGNATRIVASFDEDAATMGVAAASSLAPAMSTQVRELVLATSTPPYLDKTNAAIAHAALGLDRTVAAHDCIGTARSTMATMRSAWTGVPTMLLAADVRVGRPGSADERSGSDVACALVIAPESEETPALAEILACASFTEEFLDRWRLAGEPFAATWEERFGYERYAPLIRRAAANVLDAAGIAAPDHVVSTCPNSAVMKRASSLVKGVTSTSGSPVGFAGASDPLVALGGLLDTAGAGQTILLISAVDGVDAVVLRTTAALPRARQHIPLAEALSSPVVQEVRYPTYLSWRGLLDVEPPRRPDPDRPAGPPSSRNLQWKYGLNGSRCSACGFVHMPAMRICRSCGADRMEAIRMATHAGRVATFTVDRLAYSPSPPVVDVVVDFGGGGRATFEVADARSDELAVGAAVEMTFRRLFTAQGVHNYFWKARQKSDRPTGEDML